MSWVLVLLSCLVNYSILSSDMCSLLMWFGLVCVDLIFLKVCFKCPFTVLSDLGRYFCTIFAVNPGHIVNKSF